LNRLTLILRRNKSKQTGFNSIDIEYIIDGEVVIVETCGALEYLLAVVIHKVLCMITNRQRGCTNFDLFFGQLNQQQVKINFLLGGIIEWHLECDDIFKIEFATLEGVGLTC
jgi:hypothetical protein